MTLSVNFSERAGFTLHAQLDLDCKNTQAFTHGKKKNCHMPYGWYKT